MKYIVCFAVALFCVVVFSTAQTSFTVTINARDTAQTINNIGTSACWFSEGIGKFWPQQKKERIAELLFSKGFDDNGNPLGIGVSSFRFNIGAGTAEQGDSSGIDDFRKRVECFLNKEGTYDWNKQQGYLWFVKQAKLYGVDKLIAFVNSPPVQFTQNSLGYKTVADHKANLKEDKYVDYANFLSTVLKHFDTEGLRFDYISPVNEPQWDWSKTFGDASQEGSPWSNKAIHRLVTELDKALAQQQLNIEILLPEAAALTYLYGDAGNSNKQIQSYFTTNSNINIGNLKHVPRIVAGHSYFTDTPDSNLIAIREHLADTAKKYDVDFWQSEYCMLADGYKEGKKQTPSAIDCALFLAKMIHHDLTVAHAAAWQYWNAFEPGPADSNTRYYLIALQPNSTHTDGAFTPTKNLWALGHFSRFVRPGMKLINTHINNLTRQQQAQQLMVSAFTNSLNEMVVVAINYQENAIQLKLDLTNFSQFSSRKKYVTTALASDNMKPYPQKDKGSVMLPPRSITTIVFQK